MVVTYHNGGKFQPHPRNSVAGQNGRALQASALSAWGGAAASVPIAQREFLKRARLCGLATVGRYESALEKQAA